MRTAPSLLRNSGAMLAASMVTRVIGYASTIAMARMLGGEQFGKLSFATVLIGYFGIFVEFGTANWLVREVARARDRSEAFARAAWRLRLAFFGLGLPLFAGVVLLIRKTPDVKLAMALVALTLIPKMTTGIYICLMQGHERMDLVAILSVVEAFISLSMVLGALILVPSIVAITAASLICALIELVMARRLCARAGCRMGLLGECERVGPVIAGGLPFFTTAILSAAYFKVDILLMSFLLGDTAVGCYSAASRLIESARFIPWAISFPLFPVLSRGFAQQRLEIHDIQARAAALLLAAGVPIAILTSLFSREIISLMYGKEYASAATALRWLAWAMPLMYMNILFCFSAYAQDRQRQVIWLISGMFLFNVGFNLWAIPAYGIVGAAAATVLTEVIALGFYSLVLLRESAVLFKFLRLAMRIATACGGAVLLKPASEALGLPIASALVIALYCVLLVRLGAVNFQEVRSLSAVAGSLSGSEVEGSEG